MEKITSPTPPYQEGMKTGKIAQGETILFYTAVAPATPKAVLVIVHGLSEHSGRYRKLQEELAASGFASWAYDQRGFGKSSGRRTYVADYHDFLNDLAAVIAMARQAYHSDLPIFLIGHSLGGAVVATFCIDVQRSVDGIVLSAPAYEFFPLPRALHYLGLVCNRLFPTLSIPYPSTGKNLSHDPKIYRAFLADPLRQSAGTPRFYCEFRKMNEYLREQSDRITVPTLILQGTADTTVMPAGAKALHDKIGSANKRLLFYDDFYHEPFNEIGREQVIADMVGWLNKLLPV